MDLNAAGTMAAAPLAAAGAEAAVGADAGRRAERAGSGDGLQGVGDLRAAPGIVEDGESLASLLGRQRDADAGGR